MLKLPAEIRNQIYAYALQEPNKIMVPPSLEIGPPDWVHASKQICQESMKMWYHVNRFSVRIVDLDARVFHRWGQRIRDLGLGEKVYIRMGPSYNWRNLVEWCYAVWEDRDIEPLNTSARIEILVVVEGALGIAYDYRGSSWEQCENALENFRRVLSFYEPRWLDG